MVNRFRQCGIIKLPFLLVPSAAFGFPVFELHPCLRNGCHIYGLPEVVRTGAVHGCCATIALIGVYIDGQRVLYCLVDLKVGGNGILPGWVGVHRLHLEWVCK